MLELDPYDVDAVLRRRRDGGQRGRVGPRPAESLAEALERLPGDPLLVRNLDIVTQIAWPMSAAFAFEVPPRAIGTQTP